MRRIVLLLSLMGVTVALSATAAFALTDYGTNGNDTLAGTAEHDLLYGLRGEDTIRGLGGGDDLFGGPGNDTVRGGAEADLIYLGQGNDTGYGGGADGIDGGLGSDIIYAGDDDIDVSEGIEGNDFVYCGEGLADKVLADSLDEVDLASCETYVLTNAP